MLFNMTICHKYLTISLIGIIFDKNFNKKHKIMKRFNMDEDLFNVFFGGPVSSMKTVHDDYEINYTKDGAYLLIEVPGYNKNDLSIELDNGYLNVDGKRTYVLNGESRSRTISKRFRLNTGDGKNNDSIEATVEDGLLSIFVPNYKESSKKKIKIQ